MSTNKTVCVTDLKINTNNKQYKAFLHPVVIFDSELGTPDFPVRTECSTDLILEMLEKSARMQMNL